MEAMGAVRDGVPARERLLAGLGLLNSPSEVRTVVIAAEAATGVRPQGRQVASLRRSERSSWDSRPGARPAYVVPALNRRGFEPLRGWITSSEWSLEDRILGPLSMRAAYLSATLNVLRAIPDFI